MDKALADSVFWPDCQVDYHGIFSGTGHEFVAWVWQAHAAMERHSHQISNVLVEFTGDVTAVSEAYVTVCLWTQPDAQGQQQEITARGRYLDRLEKRDGRWAIARREHVVDMHTAMPLQRAAVSDYSSRDASDASWHYFDRSET